MQASTAKFLQPTLASYGLMPKSVMAVTESGASITLPVGDDPGPSTQSNVADDRVARSLYLLDKYGVSDECFHELAQVRKRGCDEQNVDM